METSRQYRVALMMALAALCTLAGYEFVRSSSTVLFKAAYGVERLPLVMAAMPVVMFAGVALYGWILTRLGPRRTLLVTSLGSSLAMFAAYLMLLSGSKAVTPALFLLKEFYIVLLIEQYWSYINSSLGVATARRVNGPIAGVAGIGSVIGASMVAFTAEGQGAETMVLLGAIALIPGALISDITYRWHGEPQPIAHEVHRGTTGIGHVVRNPLLASLLAVVLITQVVAAVLDLKFQTLLSAEFAGETDRETAFQGRFWAMLNGSVMVLQFVVAPLLMTFVAIRWIHLLMPAIHMVAIGVALAAPSVFTVGLAFFLFKAFDYSVFRAAKEVLYIPLGFEERYRAKELIDVFGYRSGKGASAAAIALVQQMGVVMANLYLGIGLAMAALWFALVFPLTRRVREANQDAATEGP